MSTRTATEENRTLIRTEFDRAWNRDELDALDELYADTVCIATTRSGSDEALVTREDSKELHGEWDGAFPDATTEINAMVAEGDAVMVWWTLRGTHLGTFRGIEPTGSQIAVDGFSYRRIDEGTIVEVKDAASMATLFSQLGVELPA
ncbi:hypothetical protein C5B86_03345 [Haloferax sp. Atlit-19N]|uniref:ester cyclase n=1 Tax=Haloferax sp. Atlit-19N TaxID=2077201 RepID=UPI000E23B75C|nr:ester cyclase [Haloferax sp. Atlit-19N]RDZ48108.1 hypothetical protein C5B86_03345 [Haloferax sp. Atlit-19N]